MPENILKRLSAHLRIRSVESEVIEPNFQAEGVKGGSISAERWEGSDSFRVHITYDNGAADYLAPSGVDVRQYWLPALETDWRDTIYKEPHKEDSMEKTRGGGINVERSNNGGLIIKPFFSIIDDRVHSSIELDKNMLNRL